MDKLKTVITKKEVRDKRGWVIPKGTELHIITELKNPITKETELIVYVDNGTGDYDLMPKTLLLKKDL